MPSGPPSSYIHSLTTSFASTLDEIPQDLCRHFADLRELDAVLSQSLSGITQRIEQLTERIEGGLKSIESLKTDRTAGDLPSEEAKEEEILNMFAMIHGIAEDSARIKLGGEDKIRVASLAADHMNAYYQNLLTVVRRMYDVDPAYNLEILAPYTTYPHVPPLALIDPAPENRRGAPRRTVAVQNNSYHLPNYSSQNANHRNEGNLRISSVRDRDGESPNKRRRIQSGRGDVGGGETDDYSTPRRGHAALDAEAYRPGGNTATRARQQGRKVREGRQVNPTPSTEGPSNAPETTGLGRDTGIAGMPTYPDLGGKQSNGRRTGHSTNPNPNPNPNPQPQPYPMSYNSYPPQPPSQSQSSRTQYNPSSTAYDSGAYQQQQNLNPAMDSVPPGYHHHHNSMNMNPNLNHMNTGGASGGGYSHPSGMGMLIPPSTTQLPPPPTSGSNGRPGSGNANLSRYDSANANGGGSRHRPDTLYSLAGGKSPSRTGELNKEKEFPTAGASAQGGLMPVPMLTSLPPPTTVTPLASLGIANHSPPPPPAVSNPEIHGRPRGYSGYGNGAYSDSAPQPTSGYGSLNASGYANAPGSATTAPSYGRESSSKGRDVHPSLMNIQKEYPSHTREPSLPSAGPNSAGSGVLHASLARDPPFRTGSAGSTDRDRAGSTGVMNRPRSGTASGGNPAAYHPSVDNHPGGGYDREQDNHGTGSSSAFGRHPSLAGGNGSGMTSHPSSHTSARYGYSIKEEIPNERERSDYNSYAYKRMIDVDEKPYGRDVDIEMTGADEKSTRAPIRRKHIDDTSRGSRGYGDRDRGYGGGGPDRDGEVIEVQTADEDSKPYCICRQPSFGQMIGCDDSECEFEWFHIGCLGMTEAPVGDWTCDSCQERKAKQEGRRPGKKKGISGGRGRGV